VESGVTQQGSGSSSKRFSQSSSAYRLAPGRAQQLDQKVTHEFDQKLFSEMRWRCIGPFAADALWPSAACASAQRFLHGRGQRRRLENDGLRNTWNSIFDDQPTGSVGALAVAPSDPNIIYVGSGEGLQRPDLATGWHVQIHRRWKNLDAYAKPSRRPADHAILVDPKDPNRVFVPPKAILTARMRSAASSVPLTVANFPESSLQGREHWRRRSRL